MARRGCQLDNAQTTVVTRWVFLAAILGVALGWFITPTLWDQAPQSALVQTNPTSDLNDDEAWSATGPVDSSRMPERIPAYGKRGRIVGSVLSADLLDPELEDEVVVYRRGTDTPIGRVTEHGFESLDSMNAEKAGTD